MGEVSPVIFLSIAEEDYSYRLVSAVASILISGITTVDISWHRRA